MKDDDDKPRTVTIIPPYALDRVARLMTQEAKSHGDGDAPAYLSMSGGILRYMDAAGRHLNARARGEFIDRQSGASHLVHAAASLLIAAEIEIREAEQDDESDNCGHATCSPSNCWYDNDLIKNGWKTQPKSTTGVSTVIRAKQDEATIPICTHRACDWASECVLEVWTGKRLPADFLTHTGGHDRDGFCVACKYFYNIATRMPTTEIHHLRDFHKWQSQVMEMAVDTASSWSRPCTMEKHLQDAAAGIAERRRLLDGYTGPGYEADLLFGVKYDAIRARLAELVQMPMAAYGVKVPRYSASKETIAALTKNLAKMTKALAKDPKPHGYSTSDMKEAAKDTRPLGTPSPVATNPPNTRRKPDAQNPFVQMYLGQVEKVICGGCGDPICVDDPNQVIDLIRGAYKALKGEPLYFRLRQIQSDSGMGERHHVEDAITILKGRLN